VAMQNSLVKKETKLVADYDVDNWF